MGSKAVITFKMMPTSPEVNLEDIQKAAQALIVSKGAIGETKTLTEPIAFGLSAVKVLAMFDVEGADFDKIAEELNKIENVQSAEVAKMDLALG